MKPRRLSVADVEFIAFRLARETMTWDEPIPPFQTRYPHILESCLGAPFQTWQRKLLTPGLIGKSAVQFYFMIKNHPFQNGNKRLAMTTLLVFLHVNGHWLDAGNKEFYNFAVWVAGSKPRQREEVIVSINRFIRSHFI